MPPRNSGRPAAGASTPLTSRKLVRQALFDTLRTDSELDAFCQDHFHDTYRQFSRGMDRLAKITLLLEREDPQQVLTQLRADSRPPAPPVSSPLPPTPQQLKQQAKQAVWRALLRLDRDKQWGALLSSLDDAEHLNQLVLVHGHKDQNLPLFVRRIEEHLRDKASSLVVQVPLKLAAVTAKTGAQWGLHLQQIVTAKLGADEESPAELLARATADAPLVVVLVALDNPLHLVSTLTAEQQQGLKQFLETVLPATLAACRRVTVLLPLEFRDEAQSLLPWARDLAQRRWQATPLTSIELAPLTLPSWPDVEKYLRRYPEPLRDLPALLQTVKELYDEVSRPGTTFERLASEIDNAILLHG